MCKTATGTVHIKQTGQDSHNTLRRKRIRTADAAYITTKPQPGFSQRLRRRDLNLRRPPPPSTLAKLDI